MQRRPRRHPPAATTAFSSTAAAAKGQCLLLARDGSRFAEVGPGAGDLKVLYHISRDMDFGPTLKLRMVIREDMMELYINDYLMNTKRIQYNGRIGFLGGDDAAAFRNISVWQSK